MPYFQRKQGKAANRVLLIADSEPLARAFFNLYQDCPWESHIPGQEIGVRLFNEKFQREREESVALRLFTHKEALTPELSSNLSRGQDFPEYAVAISANRRALVPEGRAIAESQRSLPSAGPGSAPQTLPQRGQVAMGGASSSSAPGGTGV